MTLVPGTPSLYAELCVAKGMVANNGVAAYIQAPQ